MIVCICHNVPEHKIREAAEVAGGDFDAVVRITRASSSCGRCLECTKEILQACNRCPTPASGTPLTFSWAPAMDTEGGAL